MIDDKIDVDVYPNWFTDCLEIVEFLQRKQTKVFYSQVKALARQFGEKEKISYKK